jgi:gamma-glutamyltranspeptidase/glutathione hydrolase
VVGVGAGGRQFALGASGGRKILGAVMQLSSFILDHRMTLEQAFHQPRIDVSGSGQVMADVALGPEILQALGEVMPVVPSRRMVFPYLFACPAGVMREGGKNMGCTEVMSP